MKLTNDSYLILLGTKNFTERYFRDQKGWLKISARGRKFRMTAEQVLNHLLPAVAGVKPNIILKVVHRESAKPARSQKPPVDATNALTSPRRTRSDRVQPSSLRTSRSRRKK
jgi:hypothetical protein